MPAGKATLSLECLDCESESALEAEATVELPETGDNIVAHDECDCGERFYRVTDVEAERDGALRAIRNGGDIAVIPSDGDNYILKVFDTVEILGRMEIRAVSQEIDKKVAAPTEASADD